MGGDRGRQVLVLAVLVLLVVPAGTAAVSRKTVNHGETVTLQATVQNPLQVPDILTLRFEGDALTGRNVDVEFPQDTSRRLCYPKQNICKLAVPPTSSTQMTVQLEGRDPGRK
ncbi:MAG: hypothetical protein ABEK12_01535, partial [Candidatus Nanohaloarchaea archaeon]